MAGMISWCRFAVMATGKLSKRWLIKVAFVDLVVLAFQLEDNGVLFVPPKALAILR